MPSHCPVGSYWHEKLKGMDIFTGEILLKSFCLSFEINLALKECINSLMSKTFSFRVNSIQKMPGWLKSKQEITRVVSLVRIGENLQRVMLPLQLNVSDESVF